MLFPCFQIESSGQVANTGVNLNELVRTTCDFMSACEGEMGVHGNSACMLGQVYRARHQAQHSTSTGQYYQVKGYQVKSGHKLEGHKFTLQLVDLHFISSQ